MFNMVIFISLIDYFKRETTGSYIYMLIQLYMFCVSIGLYALS